MKASLKFAQVAACLPLLALVACQTMPYEPYARDVKKRPGSGGVIALKGTHRDEDRAKAQSMMTQTCGGTAIKIVEEGEVVVGTETVSNSRQDYNAGTPGRQVGTLWGMPVTSGGSSPNSNTSTSSTTNAVKEWNITYECEKAVAATPAAPAAVVPAKASGKKSKQ